MSEKKNKNRFRDSLADYYKTNKQINEENPPKKGGKWEVREKAMAVAAVILVGAVAVKYLLF